MQSFSVGSALYGASAVGAAIPLAPAAFVVGLAALPVVGGIMLLSKD